MLTVLRRLPEDLTGLMIINSSVILGVFVTFRQFLLFFGCSFRTVLYEDLSGFGDPEVRTV